MTTVNIRTATPRDPFPAAVFYGNTPDQPADALPFSYTCRDPNHALYPAGWVQPRPPLYTHYEPVQSVNGNLVGIPATGHFQIWRNQWLQGGSVNIYRMFGLNDLRYVKSTTCTDYFANEDSDYYLSINTNAWVLDPQAALAFYMWFPSQFEPTSTIYFRVGSVNAAGEVAWSPTTQYTTTATPGGSDPDEPNNAIDLPADVSLQLDDSHVDTASDVDAPAAPVVTARNPDNVVDINATKPADTTGIIGYILRWWPEDPDTVPTNRVRLADASNVQADDLIVIAKEVSPGTSRSNLRHPRGWQTQEHPSNPYERNNAQKPFSPNIDIEQVEDANYRVFHRLTIPAGEELVMYRSVFGDEEQDFYSVPVDGAQYGVDSRMRRVSGDGTVELDVDRIIPAPVTWPITNQFADHRHSFTGITYLDGPVTGPQLTFHGGTTGTTFEWYPGSFWIGRTADGYSKDAWAPEDQAVLDAFKTDDGLTMHRAQGYLRAPPDGYSLELFTDPDWADGQFAHFKFCMANGVDPWFHPEFIELLNPTRALQFGEWAFAPFDPAVDTPQSKPWAHRRYVAGQQRPWHEEFSSIFFEVGNEIWTPNTKGAFYGIVALGSYSVNDVGAAINKLCFENVMASPYWTPEVAAKVKIVPGGRDRNGYSEAVGRACQDFAYAVSINSYVGVGWEDLRGIGGGQSLTYSEASLASRLQVVPIEYDRIFRELKYEMEIIGLLLAIYEGQGTSPVGPGPQILQAVDDAQNRMWSCNGFQSSVMDLMVLARKYGIIAPCFYRLGAGSYWQSHQVPIRGGGVKASWRMLGKLNKLGIGRANSITDFQNHLSDVQDLNGATVSNLEQIARYAFEAPNGNLVLTMVSRRIPGQFSDVNNTTIESATSRIIWDLPGFSAGLVHTMTGDFSTHNSTFATKDDLQLVSSAATFDGRKLITDLPPGMTQIVELGG